MSNNIKYMVRNYFSVLIYQGDSTSFREVDNFGPFDPHLTPRVSSHMRCDSNEVFSLFIYSHIPILKLENFKLISCSLFISSSDELLFEMDFTLTIVLCKLEIVSSTSFTCDLKLAWSVENCLQIAFLYFVFCLHNLIECQVDLATFYFHFVNC